MSAKLVVLISSPSAGEDILDKSALSPEDRTRADRFHFPEDRVRFLFGRLLLFKALDALDHSTATLDLDFTPLGKPQLRNHPEIHFSITHSGDFVAVAAARDTTVGIDLERIPPNFDYLAIAERVLSSTEQHAISEFSRVQQLSAFFQAWTGKEAVLKARGTGIAGGMPAVTIPLESSLGPRSLEHPWMIQGLPLPAGYVGNVVWNDPAKTVRFLEK